MKKNIKLISDFNLEIFYNFLSKKINQKIYKLHKPNFGLFYEKCFELIKNKKKSHIIFIWSKITFYMGQNRFLYGQNVIGRRRRQNVASNRKFILLLGQFVFLHGQKRYSLGIL